MAVGIPRLGELEIIERIGITDSSTAEIFMASTPICRAIFFENSEMLVLGIGQFAGADIPRP